MNTTGRDGERRTTSYTYTPGGQLSAITYPSGL